MFGMILAARTEDVLDYRNLKRQFGVFRFEQTCRLSNAGKSGTIAYRLVHTDTLTPIAPDRYTRHVVWEKPVFVSGNKDLWKTLEKSIKTAPFETTYQMDGTRISIPRKPQVWMRTQMPRQPLRKGSTWTNDFVFYKKSFPYELKLLDFVTLSGHRCAVIDSTVAFTDPDKPDVKYKFAKKIWTDIVTGIRVRAETRIDIRYEKFKNDYRESHRFEIDLLLEPAKH